MKLPNFSKAFEYENNFYLTADSSRLAKVVAQYELFKNAMKNSGEIVECGVFKGMSFIRLATFRKILDQEGKKLIGFDIFGRFPETNFDPDKKPRREFIHDAGIHSISRGELAHVLKRKGLNSKVELVKGDIVKSIPAFLKKNKNLKISFLNLDTDIYEPSIVILKYLYPRIVKGGVLLLDDYSIFPGETRAVDEYFKDKKVKIHRFSYSLTPRYIIKK